MSISSQQFTQNLSAAWRSGDVGRIAEQYAQDAVLDHVLFPEPLRGREAIAQAEGGMFSAFSDIDWQIHSATGHGETLAIEWVVKATHSAPMPTPAGPLAATGRRITVRGSSHMTLAPSGAILRENRYLDGAGMFAQLTS